MSSSAFPGKSFFDEVYRGPAPWDIGGPQPDLLRLIEELPPAGRILDVGCGTGDLAIALARRGHAVLGVDFAEAAIEVARARLRELPAARRSLVRLEVGDALSLSGWKGAFESVVDSGFLHLFDADTRGAFVDELAGTIPPGGRYYLLGFAVSLPASDVPREVTSAEARLLFSTRGGWDLLALRPASFRAAGFGEIPALALCAERLAPR